MQIVYLRRAGLVHGFTFSFMVQSGHSLKKLESMDSIHCLNNCTCRFNHLLQYSSRKELPIAREEFVDYQLLGEDSIP